jgi:hypothetical protein
MPGNASQDAGGWIFPSLRLAPNQMGKLLAFRGGQVWIAESHKIYSQFGIGVVQQLKCVLKLDQGDLSNVALTTIYPCLYRVFIDSLGRLSGNMNQRGRSCRTKGGTKCLEIV